MREYFRNLFVQVLRSGRFTQVKGYWKTDEGYCAIGVLMELMCAGAWRRVADAYSAKVTYEWLYSGEQLHAIFSVSEIKRIIFLNDKAGLTFAEIADRIEQGKLFQDCAMEHMAREPIMPSAPCIMPLPNIHFEKEAMQEAIATLKSYISESFVGIKLHTPSIQQTENCTS